MSKSSTATVSCPHCGGRKTISVGPDEVECATCGGTGRIKVKYTVAKGKG